MERMGKILLIITMLAVILMIFVNVDTNKIHKTTFAGQPAYGKVNSNGSYSFFTTTSMKPITLPQGEAVALH